MCPSTSSRYQESGNTWQEPSSHLLKNIPVCSSVFPKLKRHLTQLSAWKISSKLFFCNVRVLHICFDRVRYDKHVRTGCRTIGLEGHPLCPIRSTRKVLTDLRTYKMSLYLETEWYRRRVRVRPLYLGTPAAIQDGGGTNFFLRGLAPYV